MPSLATAWKIAPDNKSVTRHAPQGRQVPQRQPPSTRRRSAGTLKKAADPQKGKNVYATMSFVKDWTVVDASTIR